MSDPAEHEMAAVVRDLLAAPEAQLLDAGWVADQVRRAGLYHDPRGIYSQEDARHMHPAPGKGLYQVPAQLAEALVHLSSLGVRSMLEVGTCSGWTTTFVCAYLVRFGLRTLHTLDLARYASLLDEGLRGVWAAFDLPVRRTLLADDGVPLDPDEGRYDLVFIDGLHTYEGVSFDFAQYAPRARLVMFHDIQDAHCPDVVRFWSEVRASGAPVVEFTGGQSGLMGIGLVAISGRPISGLAGPVALNGPTGLNS